MMSPWMSEISTRSGPNRSLWNTHVHDANEAISTRSAGCDGRKKDRLPPRADERDRALYAKLRDYLIRVDDDVTCKTCQKRFEIPSHQTMVFLDERSSRTPSGNDDDDNRGNRA
jgi:hypothetical protein